MALQRLLGALLAAVALAAAPVVGSGADSSSSGAGRASHAFGFVLFVLLMVGSVAAVATFFRRRWLQEAAEQAALKRPTEYGTA